MASSGTVRLLRPATSPASVFLPLSVPSPGEYSVGFPGTGAISDAGNLSSGLVAFTPLWIPGRMVIDRLAIRHAAASTVNYLLGIYTSDRFRVPDRLIFQGAVASAGSAAVLEASMRLTLEAGMYHSCLVPQGATGNYRRYSPVGPPGFDNTTTNLFETLNANWFYINGGYASGDLPSKVTRSMVIVNRLNDSAPLFLYRRAS